MKHVSQGRRLVDLLCRRGMTTMEMLQTGISCAPWKRLSETLRPDEHLVATKNERGLNVYRVIKPTRWSA